MNRPSIDNILQAVRHNTIVRDSSWALVGSAVGKGCSMIAGIVIARLLGAEIYGEYGMIKSTLAYVATFATFGLGYSTTKYIAENIKTTSFTDSVINSSIIITVVFSGLMALLLLSAAGMISEDPHLTTALRYTALIVIFYAVNNTQTGLLSGFGDFKAIAMNNGIAGILTFILSCILTFNYGLGGAIASLFIATIVQCLLNHISVRKHRTAKISLETVKDGRLIKNLLSFSFPIALQESISIAAGGIQIFMLVRLSGYNELGLFTASNQWYVLLLFIPGVLRNVILSHLSRTSDERESHNRIFYTMMKINIAATFIPAVFLALLSPVICKLYGHTFDGFIYVLLIAISTSVFGCIASIYTQECFSRGKNWIIVWCCIVRDFGALVIACPLMMKYGREFGAAIMYGAVFIAHVVYCIILHLYKRNYDNIAG